MLNYSVQDAQAVVLAFALFPAILLCPGYLLGVTLNCIGFRKRSPLIRILLSLVLSVSCTPILFFLAAKVSNLLVVTIYAVVWIAFAVHITRHRQATELMRAVLTGSGKIGSLIAVGIALVACISLIDLQMGHRLYYSMSAYDYNFRAAVIDSISRRGIPAISPFFHPGHDNPFRYHYFWFMLCSFAQRIAGGLVSPRQAQIAGSCWIGIVLCATVALYVRFFSPKGAIDVRKRVLYALSLLCISGLDIIPVALKSLSNVLHHTQVGVFGSAEWWSADPVTTWIHAVLWVPHHLAGLIACLTGFLVLWDLGPEVRLSQRAKSWLAAGLCFASAIGLSVHVTFAFAVSLGIWAAVAAWRKWYWRAQDLLASGSVAALVGAPFLLTLISSGEGRGKATFPLVFGVREFRPLDALLVARGSGSRIQALGDLLALPLNYFAEFGFFAVIAVLFLRGCRTGKEEDRQYRFVMCSLAGAALVVCTFIRSGVIGNNDLGWRGILIVQFLLLLAAIDYLIELRQPLGKYLFPSGVKPLLLTLLTLGILPGLFETVTQRFHSVLVDNFHVAPDLWAGEEIGMGARAFSLREVYNSLDKLLPTTAILQHNPGKDQDIPSGLYANRQRVLMGKSDYTAFGGSIQQLQAALTVLLPVFRFDSTVADFETACREYQIDAMVVNSGDPVWKNSASWVWSKQPLAQATEARAISCTTR